MTNKIIFCQTCNQEFKESDVQKVVAGVKFNYICPKCQGPCFEKKEEVDEREALLYSPPMSSFKKFMIVFAILLAALAYIYPHYWMAQKNEDDTKKMKKKIEEVMNKPDDGGDLFDKVALVSDMHPSG